MGSVHIKWNSSELATTATIDATTNAAPTTRSRGGHDNQPQIARYEDILGTQPPLFFKAHELDAGACVRAIESKFAILMAPCSWNCKAVYAAQQLWGPALFWWENHRALLPDDHVVTWHEFKTGFMAHHIPEGLIERKLEDFLALTQGNHIVLQYAQVFNGLCQYAGHHADTDAKKMEWFRIDLNSKLKERRTPVAMATFNDLVNIAIAQEDAIMAYRAENKRKAPAASANGHCSTGTTKGTLAWALGD